MIIDQFKKIRAKYITFHTVKSYVIDTVTTQSHE